MWAWQGYIAEMCVKWETQCRPHLKHDFLKEETFREQGSDSIFLGQARERQQ